MKMEYMSLQSLFKDIYTGTLSQFVGQRLKRLSYCDVLYHEQVMICNSVMLWSVILHGSVCYSVWYRMVWGELWYGV